MAELSAVLLVVQLAVCWGQYIRDGGQPRLHIFHHSCALKKDEGPCKALKDRFYFDIETGHCERFEYGGCQGNANNFESLEQCEEMCMVKENKSPCHLEDEPGPCRGLVPRYFFNSRKQECSRFFYGGCFGNANNFKTLKECRDRCQRNDTNEPRPDHKPEEHVKPSTAALLKPDKLVDTASHLQPHTQPSTEPSKDKPVDTASHLQRHTQPSPEPRKDKPVDTASHLQRHTQPSPEPRKEFWPPELCLSRVDRGHCDQLERRYAYNPRVKRCQVFFYSGCGGNKNNFTHKRHCLKTCTPDSRRLRQIQIRKDTAKILFRSV